MITGCENRGIVVSDMAKGCTRAYFKYPSDLYLWKRHESWNLQIYMCDSGTVNDNSGLGLHTLHITQAAKAACSAQTLPKMVSRQYGVEVNE
jgi:hypothetical protein